jgi:AraC-like DNA-binding protein
MERAFTFDVRFFRLSEALQPYFTALYYFEFDGSDGQVVEDYLHPEWAVMRFVGEGEPPRATIGPGSLLPQWPFVVSGPTSRSIRFGISRSRIWGLGLLPAGWARFVDGKASAYADRTLDGSVDPAFALFNPLMDMITAPNQATDATAMRINAYLMLQLQGCHRNEAAIIALHAALRDPEIANVPDLAERLGTGKRKLERLCARYFGFAPKQLLRRQRFLRSLSHFMLGSGNWSEAMDGQYYDQAQFVKDFKSFMFMTPSEYAETPHPILSRIMAQRMADAGVAPQTDLPTILRYGAEPQFGPGPTRLTSG